MRVRLLCLLKCSERPRSVSSRSIASDVLPAACQALAKLAKRRHGGEKWKLLSLSTTVVQSPWPMVGCIPPFWHCSEPASSMFRLRSGRAAMSLVCWYAPSGLAAGNGLCWMPVSNPEGRYSGTPYSSYGGSSAASLGSQYLHVPPFAQVLSPPRGPSKHVSTVRVVLRPRLCHFNFFRPSHLLSPILTSHLSTSVFSLAYTISSLHIHVFGS